MKIQQQRVLLTTRSEANEVATHRTKVLYLARVREAYRSCAVLPRSIRRVADTNRNLICFRAQIWRTSIRERS